MQETTPYRPQIKYEAATVTELLRHTPVWAEVDVCIIGGGAAGLGAAIGASRAGAESILVIERYGFCGGATVAGMSNTMCGLFASGTPGPEFVTTGFSREFHQRLHERGGIAEPWAFGKTFLAVHDPLAWKELSDGYLVDAGVGILFHTLFVDAIKDERKISHVLLENKNGRGAIAARSFIDASGDADLAYRAGCSFVNDAKGVTQAPSMMFRMMNVDVPLAMKTGPELLEAKVKEAKATGRYDLPRTHCYMYPSPRNNEYACNMTRINPPPGSNKPCLSGIDTDDLTYCEIEGRRLVREYERFLRDNIAGFADAVVNDVGVQIGIRQTRSVACRQTLKNSDVLSARKFDSDAVSRSAWPIEDHSTGEVNIVYIENDYYEIPAQALVPPDLDNLWIAGRCFSAEHEALASARVTAQCLEMGYAAGCMATLGGLP